MGNACAKGSAGQLLAAADLDAIKNKASAAAEAKKKELEKAAQEKKD